MSDRPWITLNITQDMDGHPNGWLARSDIKMPNGYNVPSSRGETPLDAMTMLAQNMASMLQFEFKRRTVKS